MLAIATDAGPCHGPPASPEITEPKDAAASPNSVVSPSHAAAAASIDPEPAPAYRCAEFNSGGNTAKLINASLSQLAFAVGYLRTGPSGQLSASHRMLGPVMPQHWRRLFQSCYDAGP